MHGCTGSHGDDLCGESDCLNQIGTTSALAKQVMGVVPRNHKKRGIPLPLLVDSGIPSGKTR